jgi:hypothetical protein
VLCVCEYEKEGVPDDGFGRQRVFLAVADGLTETLSSIVYVGKQGGIVSVQRRKVSGKLRSAAET